jgi:hypothetical protein
VGNLIIGKEREELRGGMVDGRMTAEEGEGKRKAKVLASWDG